MAVAWVLDHAWIAHLPERRLSFCSSRPGAGHGGPGPHATGNSVWARPAVAGVRSDAHAQGGVLDLLGQRRVVAAPADHQSECRPAAWPSSIVYATA